MARSRELGDGAKRRLSAAVAHVESRSAAEIVVAVRRSAGRYSHAGLALGAALAYAALLYMLFAPPIFELEWIAAIEVIAFASGWALTLAVPGLGLLLTRADRIQHGLTQAARATFVELGVSATRARTGILVYVAQLERRVTVVADMGVLASVPEAEWTKAVAALEGLALERSVERSVDALGAAIESLAGVLETHLPRAEDDEDELENVA